MIRALALTVVGIGTVWGVGAAGRWADGLTARRRAGQLVASSARTWHPRVALRRSVVTAMLPALARRVGRGRHRTAGRADADMVELLEAVARSLRSGAGLHTALAEATAAAGIHGAELGAVLRATERGTPLPVALDGWRDRADSATVGLAVAALSFGVHTGASLARAVDGAAASLRERQAIRAEVRGQAAQARSSAAVVGLAPAVFTGVATTADPAVAAFLFSSPLGWACLAVGAGLEIAGLVWMRLLVTRSGLW